MVKTAWSCRCILCTVLGDPTETGEVTWAVPAARRGADSFTYDAAHRLRTATVADTTETSAYDGEGVRFNRQVDAGPRRRRVVPRHSARESAARWRLRSTTGRGTARLERHVERGTRPRDGSPALPAVGPSRAAEP